MAREEEPLFHRAKWTPNDRQCLAREIERGGDWVRRGADHLGRSPGAVVREARRLADTGVLPARMRSDIYAARLQHERKAESLTPARKQRMAASFEALTGHPIRDAAQRAPVVPTTSPSVSVMAARARRFTPENGFTERTGVFEDGHVTDYPVTRAEQVRGEETDVWPDDLKKRPPLGVYRVHRRELTNVKSTDDVPEESQPERPSRWERLWRWIGGE